MKWLRNFIYTARSKIIKMFAETTDYIGVDSAKKDENIYKKAMGFIVDIIKGMISSVIASKILPILSEKMMFLGLMCIMLIFEIIW